MQFKKLGQTDIEVSTVAMGCWAIVGGLNWGHQDKVLSLAALRAAYDAGITFFDTAEMYGDGYSEQLIAEALHDVRDQIIIASKARPEHFSRAKLREACERSLKNLQTDYLDLYQLHWPNRDIPVDEPLEELDRLQAEGKIRAYGVSNYGPNDLDTTLDRKHAIQSNQLAYSLLFRAIEYDIVPRCIDHNISILCYSPLLHGLLTGKFKHINDIPEDRARTRHFNSSRWAQARHGEQGVEDELMTTIEALRPIADEMNESMANIALAWLMQQPGVTSVIMGGRNADQVQRNAQAAEVVLPAEVIERLNEISQPLKEKLGPNADMWQGGVSRVR